MIDADFWRFDFGDAVTITAFGVAIVGAWFDLRNRAVNSYDAAKRAEVKTDATAALLQLTRSEFSEFREKVASQYVTVKAMGEMRAEINENFRQLDGKLDRVVERMLDKS